MSWTRVAGLGFPAGYPGSVLPAPLAATAPRDERLAALAWQAVARGQAEIVLTDETIAKVTAGDAFNPCYVQAHVELAASIRTVSCEALDRGDCILAVAPARAVGPGAGAVPWQEALGRWQADVRCPDQLYSGSGKPSECSRANAAGIRDAVGLNCFDRLRSPWPHPLQRAERIPTTSARNL
jgi:hypothetical protein